MALMIWLILAILVLALVGTVLTGVAALPLVLMVAAIPITMYVVVRVLRRRRAPP